MKFNGLRNFLIFASVLVSSALNAVQYADIVISEILVDAEPAVAQTLPEFVEVCNRSTNAIQLTGWRLWYGEKEYAIPSFYLAADSFAVLCSKAAVSSFESKIQVVGMSSFPSLANSKGQLALVSTDDESVNCLAYSDSWYGSPFKKEGGWSLECKDLSNLSGHRSNWSASVNSTGATPGRLNSVAANEPDQLQPRCEKIVVPTPGCIELYFNKPMSARLLGFATINLSPERSIVLSTKLSFPDQKKITLMLSDTLESGVDYTLKCSGLYDISELPLNDTLLYVGLPRRATSDALRINEVLFNPKPGGCDYVELVHVGDGWVDLSSVFLASRLDDGTLSKAYRLTPYSIPCGLNSLWLMSVSKDSVCKAGSFPNAPDYLDLDGFPSFSDESGTVVLVTSSGEVVDEMHYDANMHFALISNVEGVALERRNPTSLSDLPSTWISASSTSNYGTPGFANSQFQAAKQLSDAGFSVDRSWLTPDNDGKDDVLTIQYKVEAPCLANLRIYDVGGRLVKSLLKNALLGQAGEILWDGTDGNREVLPFGRYVLFVERFDPNGNVFHQKMVLSVLR
jgi:hypothetical protein